MSVLTRTREAIGGRDWAMTVISIAAVVGIGVLAGNQYVNPDKRVLAVAAAAVLFGLAWRVNMVTALGALLVLIPFPRFTSFGSTNLAFILLLLVIWLLRVTQRQAPAPRRTPVDQPLIALVIAYIISFYNVEKFSYLAPAIRITLLFVACLIMFFLIVQNVRTVEQLRRFHTAQIGAMALVYAFCLWELIFPGHQLIPGWIDFSDINVGLAQTGNYRVGGPFIDYELLSEFAALNLIFLAFMIAQAKSQTRRLISVALLLVSMLLMFATVTRGGMAAFGVGLAYLLFLVRRRIQVVPFTILAGVSLIVVLALNFYVHRYTVAGDVFARFGNTKFVGLIPDSRADAWPQAFHRWLEHPIIGHGPLYSAERGLKLWSWPHCLPLYLLCCFGVIGFGVFVWLMWKLWNMTRPRTDQMDDSNYVDAFLLAARVQLVIFFVDEVKIEYLRNSNYQFQPWVLFASIVAAAMIQRTAASAQSPAAVSSAALPSRA